MGAIGGILYLAGLGLSFLTGFNGADWYWIFVSSFIIAIGHLFIRAPQIFRQMQESGFLVIFKIIAFSTGGLAIVTAPLYFVGTLFN